ncbi:MAG: ABC transporter ATP-binding protein [Anaerolineales bacterium]
MDTILDAVGLHKRYPTGDSEVAALRGVDLKLAAGDFVAVMGPSGSGKTTLLQLLAGLELPSEGRVALVDQHLEEMDDDARTVLRRRQVGVIFQFFNLLPTLTAAENVALPLMLAGEGRRQYQKRVAEALSQVGLTERADHLPDQLSGGEQQRVAIARALVAEPAVVLADEPTGNLDRASGERALAILRQACDQRQQAIVLVTHDPLAASYADRVLFLRDGQIVDRLDGPRPAVAEIVKRLGRLEVE